MGEDGAPADGSIRTMRDDLKKVRRPAPPQREYMGRGRERLDEIINRAEAEGGGAVLRELKRPQMPVENLDELLPIEQSPAPQPREKIPAPQPVVGDIQKSKAPPAGSPPKNLPGIAGELQDELTPAPDESEGEEMSAETPEQLLDLSDVEIEEKQPPIPEPAGSDTEQTPAARVPWKFITALFMLAGVGTATGFLIWTFFIAGGEEPQPTTEPPVSAPKAVEAPTPILPADFEVIVRSAEELFALEFSSATPKITIYAPYYKEDTEAFANPEELFAELGLRAPSPFFRLINEAVMPYVYIPGAEEQDRCAQGAIAENSCFSPRFGVVFSVPPTNRELVRGVMDDWERTMAQDLRPMVWGDPALPPDEFQTATYRGIGLRYMNLPISTTALNYALADSFVIIATSKNSLYAILDTISDLGSGQN